jgi:signal transduction histidine kinase
MKVGNRLFIAVLPAVFGLVLVAALGYWGRYAFAVPEILLIIAAVAAILSLVFAWSNTHYVVARIERLAGLRLPHIAGVPADPVVSARDALRDLGMKDPTSRGRGSHGAGDELDAIEATVTGLSSAVAIGREESARLAREAGVREKRFEELLDEVTTHFADRTQEARMPLHILLSSPFGALNENQEEMLGAAQTAVDAVDTEVRQLRKLLQLHRGQLPIITQPIGVAELLRPPLAIAGARAERRHVQMRPTLSETMPRVVVDAVHAQEALTSILVNAVCETAEGRDLEVDVRETEQGLVRIHLVIGGKGDAQPLAPGLSPDSIELRLAQRLLEAQNAVVTEDDQGVSIDLPIETASRVTRSP